MLTTRHLIIFSVTLLFSFTAFAQYQAPGYNPAPYQPPRYTPPTTPIHSTPAIPNSIQYGNQYYDGSVSGLRDYMDAELKTRKPKLYKHLNTQLESLESKNRTAWIVGGVGMAAGLIYMFAGSGDIDKCDIDASNYDSCMDTETDKDSQALIIGGGLAFGSIFAAMALKPGRKDMMNFINQHNRYNKKSPLKWQIGLSREGSPTLAATYRF